MLLAEYLPHLCVQLLDPAFKSLLGEGNTLVMELCANRLALPQKATLLAQILGILQDICMGRDDDERDIRRVLDDRIEHSGRRSFLGPVIVGVDTEPADTPF